MTDIDLINKASLELVQELLTAPEGEPWAVVIRRKLMALVAEINRRQR